MLKKAWGQQDKVLVWLTIGNFLFVAGVSLVIHFAPEEFWPAALATHLPRQIYIPSTLVLLLYLLWRKEFRFLGANLPALLLLLFPVLGLNFSFPRSGATDAPLRVMTYNIRHGARGVEKVAAVIQAQNPDIICLQEAEEHKDIPDPVPELKKLLPEYQFSRYFELVTLSKLPVVSNRRHALPRQDNYGALETQVLWSGQRISIFNVHLTNPIHDSIEKWPAQIPKRAPMRVQHAAVLTMLTSGTKHGYFVAGDFNTQPGGKLYRSLTRFGSDSFATAGNGFGWTYPSKYPLIRIDYVFTGPGLQAVSYQQPATLASDHRPIVVELTSDSATQNRP